MPGIFTSPYVSISQRLKGATNKPKFNKEKNPLQGKKKLMGLGYHARAYLLL
jgi:hypothetical protein